MRAKKEKGFQPTIDSIPEQNKNTSFFPNFRSSFLQATVLFIKVHDLSLFVLQSDYLIFFALTVFKFCLRYNHFFLLFPDVKMIQIVYCSV